MIDFGTWLLYSSRELMERLYREFGHILRKRRQAADLTQDDVASRVGLARTSITNIERGRQHVSLHLVYELANAIGIAPHELLPGKAVLLQQDAELEKTLGKESLAEDAKDWIRRVVSKADQGQKGNP
jgi:transcriptional regulator with XRE-family HTH domain